MISYDEELRKKIRESKISENFIFTGGKPLTFFEKVKYNIGLIKDFFREYKENRQKFREDKRNLL